MIFREDMYSMLFVCNVKDEFKRECEKEYKNYKRNLKLVKKLELDLAEKRERGELDKIVEEEPDLL